MLITFPVCLTTRVWLSILFGSWLQATEIPSDLLKYKRGVAFVKVREKVSARERMVTPVGLFSPSPTIQATLETWVSPLTFQVLGEGMWWVRLGWVSTLELHCELLWWTRVLWKPSYCFPNALLTIINWRLSVCSQRVIQLKSPYETVRA